MLNVEICEMVKKLQQEFAETRDIDDQRLETINSKIYEEVQNTFADELSQISEAICTTYIIACVLEKDEEWVKDIYKSASTAFKNAVDFRTNVSMTLHKVFH